MIINLKSQTDLSGFYIVYEGSTNLENKGNFGISHLMEHLCCKNFDHLLDDFDRDAISWNAYTDTNLINFYFTGLESKLSKYREKIIELMSNFNVTKEQFEIERNIVLSEYEDVFNDQSQSHYLNLYRKLFNDYDPIGLREDLEKLTFIDCLNFYEKQYMNPSKVINVSKNFKFKSSDIDFVNRDIVKDLNYGKHDAPLELGNQFKDKTSVILLSPVVKENWNYVNFINAMLSMGLKSPLYSEIREKLGLVYFIHCYQSRINKDGLVNISTLTNNKNVNQLLDGLKKVLKDKDKIFTKERFNIVKDYYSIRKQKEEILRYDNINSHLIPDGWSTYDILDEVKIKDLLDIYDQYYKFDNFYISTDKKEFK
jgi:predicted Zn-dependent peptidase